MQYPYNISINKLGMEFIFCMQININLHYQVGLSFSMKVTRHVQRTQSRNFYNVLRKRIATVFMFYCDAKHCAGRGPKWVWPCRSWNSKLYYTSKVNWWNKFFVLHDNTYFLLHWWVSTAVVLVNNGGFLLALTGKVSELPFSKGFLMKAW